MNKPRVKLAPDVAMRMKALQQNARQHRDGLYLSARKAAHQSSTTIPELLRRIGHEGIKTIEGAGPDYASKCVDELAFLDELLNAVADGRDVAKELRIDRPKQRKASPLNVEISNLRDDLAAMPGINKGAAEQIIGAVAGLEPDAVRKQAKAGQVRKTTIQQRMSNADVAIPKGAKKRGK
jgi:hypothetical protein